MSCIRCSTPIRPEYPWCDCRDGQSVAVGDCREILPGLEAGSVHCCVTSPPYWGLRDYGTATWDGGDAECDHLVSGQSGLEFKGVCGKCGAVRIDSQIGLEATPELFVATMVSVFREVKRVLRDDGTCWINLGDSYAQSSARDATSNTNHRGKGKRAGESSSTKYTETATISAKAAGLKPKDLCGIPWRVALALQADGWWLRQDIIWHKPNPMPESVTDRCTKSHEYMFLLTKSARYHFDAEAIAEPAIYAGDERGSRTDNRRGTECNSISGNTGETRNRRSVWTIPTKPYKGAHFATFPPKLIEPCILAGCPEGGTCLDPFAGSGTVAEVCRKLGRKSIGCELNEMYSQLSRKRLEQNVLF